MLLDIRRAPPLFTALRLYDTPCYAAPLHAYAASGSLDLSFQRRLMLPLAADGCLPALHTLAAAASCLLLIFIDSTAGIYYDAIIDYLRHARCLLICRGCLICR